MNTTKRASTKDLRRLLRTELSRASRSSAKVLSTFVPAGYKTRQRALASWFDLISESLDAHGHAFVLSENEHGNGAMLRPDWILDTFPRRWILKDLIVVERPEWTESSAGGLAHRYDFLFWNVLSHRNYDFNLDPVRIPNVTGDKRNHPMGKNPGNVWLRSNGPVTASLADFHGNFQHKRESAEGSGPLANSFMERVLLSTMDGGEVVVDPLGTLPELAKVAQRHGLVAVSLRLPTVIESE